MRMAERLRVRRTDKTRSGHGSLVHLVPAVFFQFDLHGQIADKDQVLVMRNPCFTLPLAGVSFLFIPVLAFAQLAQIKIRVVSAETSEPVACRIRVERAADIPHRDWSYKPFYQEVREGEAQLLVPAGDYLLSIEKGLEYTPIGERVRLEPNQTLNIERILRRWIDLPAQGWRSGDLHVHRQPGEMWLLLRAEDLHVAPLLTTTISGHHLPQLGKDIPWPKNVIEETDPDRFFHWVGAEDERYPGVYLYLNLRKILPLEVRKSPVGKAGLDEFPSPVHFLREARKQPGVWVDISNPYLLDVPAMVVAGVDSIEIANNASIWCGQYKDEWVGRARDPEKYPGLRGNGFYSQDLYYKFLNCGFRLPPSAGSASGVMGNYLGYNRVYVHTAGEFSYQAWWRGLAEGRAFVTNGPILLARANGALPGEVFRAPAGKGLDIRLDVAVDGADPIEAVEVVRDGEVCQSLRHGNLRGAIPLDPLHFDRSGWFLVRVIADVPGTFRFASTAPFYVEIGDKPQRLHRADIGFFIGWVEERIAQLEGKLAANPGYVTPGEHESLLAPQREALRTFRAMLEKAD